MISNDKNHQKSLLEVINDAQEHKESQGLTEDQLETIFSSLDRQENIDFLSRYFSIYQFKKSPKNVDLLIQSLLKADEIPNIQPGLYFLCSIIEDSELGMMLVNKNIHQQIVERFPSFSTLVLFKQMILVSYEVGVFLLDNTPFLEIMQNDEIFSDSQGTQLIYFLNLLSSFRDHFDLYERLLPIFPYFINSIFHTEVFNSLMLKLQILSYFCFSYKISLIFVSSPLFLNFLSRISSIGVQIVDMLFYLVQMMFSQSRYNIVYIDGKRVHSSDILMEKTDKNVKDAIINFSLHFLNEASNNKTIEYSLKALNPFILEENIPYLNENGVYDKLMNILMSEISFDTKIPAFHCLMQLFINSDNDFSLFMIENGFMIYINDNIHELMYTSGALIINSIIRYLFLQEKVDENIDIDIIFGDTNIHDTLIELSNSCGDENDDETDEHNAPLSDIANGILQKYEEQ